MGKYFTILFWGAFSCFWGINVAADITKPCLLNLIEHYEDGKLFYDNNNLQNKTFYFVKKNWINNNQTIYKWKGVQRNQTKGESFSNLNILDAIYFQDNLLLIVANQNQIYITNFDNKLSNQKIFLNTNDNKAIYSLVNYSKNRWIGSYKNDKLFFICDNNLFQMKNNIITTIADNILSCKVLDNDDYILAYIEDKNDVGLLYLLDTMGNRHYIARLPITEYNNIHFAYNYLIISNSISNNSNIFINVVDINTKTIIESDWINTNKSRFTTNEIKHNTLISEHTSVLDNNLYFIKDNNGFALYKVAANYFSDTSKYIKTNLPSTLYNPKKLICTNNKLFVFFDYHLMIFDENLRELLLNDFDYSVIDGDFSIDVYDNYFVLLGANNSYIYELKPNNFYLLNKYIKLTYRYAIPLSLMLLSFILYRKYRNQKRLLDVIVDLPSSGFLFIVNRVGKLIKINAGGKQLLGLADNMTMKKHFAYYCNLAHTHQINDLIELGLKNKYSLQQKINIIENNTNTSTEWLCSLIPLNNITGMFKGIMLTGVDITEALEKQLLTNWAQLAHDMQTNLSTIRLNAEQLDLTTKIDINRQNKILHQVSILVHRIKDIVTVGRDDKLELINTNSVSFCNEILNEFDANMFSNINFKMELTDFNFLCDRPKLLRAIRNAVENAIKYMKNKAGTITISCSKDIHNITISVRDTGIGMDEGTKKKIFTPFYSTARQFGGHGIGTMIMQRVIEQHGGKLIIESQLNVGTEILFIIPDLARRKM
ncbi:MAG: HAMP domain-containing histidine kinase [Bacteroidetes bacterium]|nr:HAMP domain-containing histidine kinase [Bacteroidota bacterium]